MALLALFGARVEPAMGWLRMLGLYLAGGLAGALAQVAASPSSLVELVGASGAIAALMGATLVIRPRPALHMLVLVAWSAIQAAALADQLVGPRTLGGGLAIWSHLAGLAVGLALALPVGRAPPAHP
jgi:membrane associated rhomboid family serine protease